MIDWPMFALRSLCWNRIHSHCPQLSKLDTLAGLAVRYHVTVSTACSGVPLST